MSLFREMIISWKGKDYSFVPTMKLMRSIEDEISIASLQIRAAEGDMPMSHANYVLTKILRSAGATVTEEDVWFELNAMGEANMIEMIKVALSAFAPVQPSTKNPAAQSESPTPRAETQAEG